MDDEVKSEHFDQDYEENADDKVESDNEITDNEVMP